MSSWSLVDSRHIGLLLIALQRGCILGCVKQDLYFAMGVFITITYGSNSADGYLLFLYYHNNTSTDTLTAWFTPSLHKDPHNHFPPQCIPLHIPSPCHNSSLLYPPPLHWLALALHGLAWQFRYLIATVSVVSSVAINVKPLFLAAVNFGGSVYLIILVFLFAERSILL